MPKKKGQNKSFPKDFTIGYFANAEKPVIKPKKVTSEPEVVNPQTAIADLAWDEIPDDVDIKIGNKLNADGTNNFICTKNKKVNNTDIIVDGDFIEYPEIVWYQISRYIDPEDIGRFALINKTTWSITHQKAFWVHIYQKYCKHKPLLPKALVIEDEPKVYGLKTKVIVALYHTHKYFINKVKEASIEDCKPTELVNRRCVGFDIFEDAISRQWRLLFKFKRKQIERRVESNFMKELGKLDANPEEDTKLLQVNFQSKYELKELHPLMGMTLTSVKMGLAKSLRSHKLVLGFNYGTYIDKGTLPEFVFSLDPVKSIEIYDWWHPRYPRFKIGIPYDDRLRDEDEHEPVLERDFFASDQRS